MRYDARHRPRRRRAELQGLLEAFNPGQARWPKGHPKAGQWRPKGTTTPSGRTSAAHLERDLMGVREVIAARRKERADRGLPFVLEHDELERLGKKLATLGERFSTTKAYTDRLESLQAERKRILDAKWNEKRDYTPAEDKWLTASAREEVKLADDIAAARRDGLLFALGNVRKMGGVKLKRGHTVDDGTFNPASDVGPIARKEKADADLAAVSKFMPADWLKAINREMGRVNLQPSKHRAWARHPSGTEGATLQVPLNDQGVVLHELAHLAEWSAGERLPAYSAHSAKGDTTLLRVAQGYLNARTRGEPIGKLSDLQPFYGPDEVATPDKFFDPYVGRRYDYPEGRQSTEVLTMGMQYLFFPAYRRNLMEDDPAHAHAIMAMLATL